MLDIVTKYRSGYSLRDIAPIYNVSVERVWQIIVQYEKKTGDKVIRRYASLFDRVSTEVLERQISERLSGKLWKEIAPGRSPKAAIHVQNPIYRYLRRNNDKARIDLIWPQGIPYWLQKAVEK